MLFGKKKEIKEPQVPRLSGRDYDRFMGRVYKMVGCHRDSDAVYMLMDEYDYMQTWERIQAEVFPDEFKQIA